MKIPDFTYRSPVIRYDALAQVEIFERRDTTTGAISFQTPSVQVVKALEQGGEPPASKDSVSKDGAAPRVSVLV
jgi:hypothetical protein